MVGERKEPYSTQRDRDLAQRCNALVAQAIQNVDFSFTLEESGQKYIYHRYMLHHVRHLIENGDIGVIEDPRYVGSGAIVAAYDRQNDKVLANRGMLGDATAGAKMAHEYTHAATDVMKYSMLTSASDEGAAFLVQRCCMGFGTKVNHGNFDGGDPLYRAVLDNAEQLMLSKNLAKDKKAVITAAEFKPLRDATAVYYKATLASMFQPDDYIRALGLKIPSSYYKNY
ncbi:MAG: hypothetical protein KIT36_13580 [Alphaproteobacteria bacterium]|nr:hypothetical protein [Alphaproteobacteria bacterium]